MKKQFRKGLIDETVIHEDPLEGIKINPNNGERNVLYYTNYGEDIAVMKKHDNGWISIGIIDVYSRLICYKGSKGRIVTS